MTVWFHGRTRGDVVPGPMRHDPAHGPPGQPFADTEQAVRAVFGLLRYLTGLPSWYLCAAPGVPRVLYRDDPVFSLVAGETWPWPAVLDPDVGAGAEPVVRHGRRQPGGRSAAVVVALTVRDGEGAPSAALYGAAPDHVPAFPRGADADDGMLAALRHHARVLATLLDTDARAARDDAIVDPLGRLADRQAWQRLLEREDLRCERLDLPAGVLVVDIDGLAALNRAHGHAAGDDLLARAATVLLRSSRGTDVVARLSGDRFAILAPGASEGHMSALGARLRLRLAGIRAPASVGWASRRGHGDLVRTWIAADRDMLRSKQSLRRGRAARP
jgi:diguanylate cyclase (GGDEF)-like protein